MIKVRISSPPVHLYICSAAHSFPLLCPAVSVQKRYVYQVPFVMILSRWLIASLVALLPQVSGFASTDSPSDADPAQSGYLPNHNMDPAVVDSAEFGLLWKISFNFQEQVGKPLNFAITDTILNMNPVADIRIIVLCQAPSIHAKCWWKPACFLGFFAELDSYPRCQDGRSAQLSTSSYAIPAVRHSLHRYSQLHRHYRDPYHRRY